MTDQSMQKLGYACAYAPLPLMEAAGFAPKRILPLGDFPDQAGRFLHDTLCPHVKKILDRAIAGDLGDLSGMVFINSCDAMRRLNDAFIRQGIKTAFLDLPVTGGERSIVRYAADMKVLYDTLCAWSGLSPDESRLAEKMAEYGDLFDLLEKARARRDQGSLSAEKFQALVNTICAFPAKDAAADINRALDEAPQRPDPKAVPVYLFGNVLPDPEAFAMIESCGARICGEDFCTGSRFLAPMIEGDGDVFARLSRSIIEKPPCARTLDPARPGGIGQDVVMAATEAGAKGVIAQYLKFCDPYLSRMPLVRQALKAAGIPLLVLEGDCTQGSIGQSRTRIEAFLEMLKEGI